MSVNIDTSSKNVIPGLYPGRGSPRKVGSEEFFVISALAPALAVLFTNPFDTIKVRLQLQGQSGMQQKQYRNSFDAGRKIIVNEGVGALQKGLNAAIIKEASKNVFRIGMYDPIMGVIHDSKQGRAPAWKRMLAGSLCGVMGAVSCNPFELVKTRLQSASSGKYAPVGHQHNYSGVWSALKSIYRVDGFRGLYKGATLSMGRSMVGSAANLTTYSMIKEYFILEMNWADSITIDMISGLGSGFVSCIFMNPLDVLRTRFYNQKYTNGVGDLYSNGFDAAKKISRNEGLRAFYKGFLTHYLRIGPHFCRILRRQANNVYHYMDQRDSFEVFDKNHDGKLDEKELEETVRKVLAGKGVGEDKIHDYTMQIIQHNPNLTLANFQKFEDEISEIYKKL